MEHIDISDEFESNQNSLNIGFTKAVSKPLGKHFSRGRKAPLYMTDESISQLYGQRAKMPFQHYRIEQWRWSQALVLEKGDLENIGILHPAEWWRDQILSMGAVTSKSGLAILDLGFSLHPLGECLRYCESEPQCPNTSKWMRCPSRLVRC